MRFGSLLFFVLGLAILGGCKLTQDEAAVTEPPPAPEPEVPVVQFQAEPGLTPPERLKKAIDLLQVGQAGQARAELSAYLPEVPDSQRARDLLLQIDADPIKMLGEENYPYKVRRGDSISSIAGKFLGDKMKFHILARYNGLENPSEIRVGQIIRIPGKVRVAERNSPAKKQPPAAEAKPPAVKKKPSIAQSKPAEPNVAPSAKTPEVAEAPEPAAGAEVRPQAAAPDQSAGVAPPKAVDNGLDDDQVAKVSPAGISDAEELKAATIKRAMLKAKGHSDAGDYSSAVNHLEEGLLEYPDEAELHSAAVVAYTKVAEQQTNEGRLEDAEKSLRRAAEIAPNDPMVGKQLAGLQKRQQIESLFQQGEQRQNEGQAPEAFDIYKRVLELDPNHAAASKELDKLRPTVTETYHRLATAALRQQDLDTAITHWNKALEVDPEYTPARLERDRAIDLKRKVESLPDHD